MTETIYEKNLFDVCFDFLVWPMSHLLTWRGTYTGHQGGDQDVLPLLLGSFCRPSSYKVYGKLQDGAKFRPRLLPGTLTSSITLSAATCGWKVNCNVGQRCFLTLT